VLPAINDAVDGKVSGKPYELAYFVYRDPEYAAIIQRGEGRDHSTECPTFLRSLLKR
jgi:hypothetical protein